MNILNFIDKYELEALVKQGTTLFNLHTKDFLKATKQCLEIFANYKQVYKKTGINELLLYTRYSNYNNYGGYEFLLKKDNKNTYWLICQNQNNFYEV